MDNVVGDADISERAREGLGADVEIPLVLGAFRR
jgi:hypothetical protein